MTFDWSNIITPLVSIISIFISHYLGSKLSERNYKRDLQKSRYYNVYVPYIQLIAKMSLPRTNPITDPKVAIAINEITFSNIQLLENESASLASQFYRDMLDYFEFFDGNSEFLDAENKINTTFIEMSLVILQEASHLSKELGLSDIAKTFYNAILQNPTHI